MQKWVIPVAAIAGCLLLFSLVGRIISLSRRKKRNATRGAPTSSGPDDYDEVGGFLTKNISNNNRTSTDNPKGSFGGGPNNLGFSSLHQFEYGDHRGGNDPPPGYKEPCEAELGYDDEELRGVSRAARQPTYRRGWDWMKKSFTNKEAFGSHNTRGPPMKRSVLSFVNLSPFSDRGAAGAATRGTHPDMNGGASHLWSPIAAELQVNTPPNSGWRDASARPFTSTDRGSPSRYNVPRRPVNASSYMPVSNLEADGRPSIAAVLAADNSNNRLNSDRPAVPDEQTSGGAAAVSRSPTARSRPETGVAAWTAAIRKISSSAYSYKREHERVPSSDDERDGDEDENDRDMHRAPSARQTSYNYRSVSQTLDADTSGPIQRSTSNAGGMNRASNLSRKSTVALQRAPTAVQQPQGLDRSLPPTPVGDADVADSNVPSIPALQRKRTIKLPEDDGAARPSRAASRISRSPSKYPGVESGEGVDLSRAPTGRSEVKSIMSVDTETRELLMHLDSPDVAGTVADTPQAGSVIDFDAASSRTPSSRSPSRLQRQGTIRSYLSSGGENNGKREQRLRRAETVVQNAVKRAATSAQRSEDGEDRQHQRLRRAATSASTSSANSGARLEQEEASEPARPSTLEASSSERQSSLTVPRRNSIYNIARKSLHTQTPEVPQFNALLSPDAATPEVSSDERSVQTATPSAMPSRSALDRTYTASSGRSEASSSAEDGPPSLVHGSSTSESEDETPDVASSDDHGDVTVGADTALALLHRDSKTVHSSKSKDKGLSTVQPTYAMTGMETPQYLDTLDAYRVEVDSPPGGEDVFAAMGRLGSHNLDFTLKSPLMEDGGQDRPEMPGKNTSVGSQINDAQGDLTASKSVLKRSSPTRKSALSRSPTRKVVPDIGVQEATPTESELAAFEAEAEHYAYTQPSQTVNNGSEKPQGVELFDPPVRSGWQSDTGSSAESTGYDTPSKKRSWKNQNGRWVAAEEDTTNDGQTREMTASPSRAMSPPPLPSPPKAAALNASPVTPRRTRHQRQDTSETIGDDSITSSRRRQRTETPEARLKATTSPASPSPFGKHAELFFSPPIGSGSSPASTPRRQGVAAAGGVGGGKYRSPRNVIPATGSPLRAPTTRTSNILQADRVRGHSGSESDSTLSAAGHQQAGSETPAGTSALNSLAFTSPFAAGLDTPLSVVGSPPRRGSALRSDISSSSDSTYQHSVINGSNSNGDLVRHNTALNAGSPRRPRRGTVSSNADSSSTEYEATDAPTISSLHGDGEDHNDDEYDRDASMHRRQRLNKKSTKSNATLSSVFTTASEQQAALDDAEQRGRAGLDSEIEKMLHRRGPTAP